MIQPTTDLEQAEEEIPVLAAQAIREAYEEALASEEGTLDLDPKSGVIYRVFSDGRKIAVEQILPSVPARVGTRIPLL